MLNVLRAGGMPRLFDEVYAPSTVGILLREFTFGHARQLASVARAASGRAGRARTDCWPGIDERVFVDIDSLLRPVYGHAKQGASFGHTKIAGKRCCARACPRWSPRSAPRTAAPVIAGMRLRGGQDRLGQGRRRAWSPRRSPPPAPPAPTRADPGPRRLGVRHREGDRAPACAAGAEFSLVLTKNRGHRARSTPSTTTPGPRCTTRARSKTPTPAR